MTSPRHQKLRADLAELKLHRIAELYQEVLDEAARKGSSMLDVLATLFGEEVVVRRQHALERRLRRARLPKCKTLAEYDFTFPKRVPKQAVLRLFDCDFIAQQGCAVFIGPTGTGKSHIVQAVGRATCVLGYRVRYATSAELLRDLTASLADHSLPQRLRYYSNFDLLVIDEFGFDKIERAESGQAASLLYKVVDSRGPNRSTALVTNIGFEAWADYLGDAPLAMAILDRLVDGAIVLKIEGRSYRAHRSKQCATPSPAEITKSKRRRESTG